mmetsp:Transcript_2757/g.4155  ORF Transcript_2757/g.4155 Transcript_2757/m.4155 type:complete len:87 (+) Transcript_2757:146-406(+)
MAANTYCAFLFGFPYSSNTQVQVMLLVDMKWVPSWLILLSCCRKIDMCASKLIFVFQILTNLMILKEFSQQHVTNNIDVGGVREDS